MVLLINIKITESIAYDLTPIIIIDIDANEFLTQIMELDYQTSQLFWHFVRLIVFESRVCDL